jgi:hypothetical protein
MGFLVTSLAVTHTLLQRAQFLVHNRASPGTKHNATFASLGGYTFALNGGGDGGAEPQPYFSADNTTAIMYDGQVFGCDMACIHALYEAHGVGAAARLHGEFSLVVIDLAAQRALLATDYFGAKVKPGCACRAPA